MTLVQQTIVVLCLLAGSGFGKKFSCEKPNWFQCSDGECIAEVFTCDGENDCSDGGDEVDCYNQKSLPPSSTRCHQDQFRCLDHICIPKQDFCNGVKDCLDGSDEYAGCVKNLKCDSSDFRCNSGHCIKSNWTCDGYKDCPDGSDEVNCEQSVPLASKCTNAFNRFLCKNRKCIPLDKVCDGANDCLDGSDENSVECDKAVQTCHRSTICTHHCRPTPRGPICSCSPGFTLVNNQSCIDIDECTTYGICDQQCYNTAGSYHCLCQVGYELQDDKKTCIAQGGEAVIIFSSKTEIRGLYLDSKVYFPMVRNLQHIVGVAADSKYIYWSDIEIGNQAIGRSLDDGSNREILVSAGLGTTEDLAVDWVTQNIYFTDSLLKHIGVCDNNGTYCTIIIRERADKPRGITLLPSDGFMFWSDWGENPHISRANMDGTDSIPFITQNIGWPNGLAIDYPNERLYWVDAKLKIIETIRLDGTDRRTVLQETAQHPYSIAVFENKLYWSDWHTNSIQSCNKFTGKDLRVLARGNTTFYGLHIYHSLLKPNIPNPCEAKPCSEICLLSVNKTYTCACTLDKVLSSDKRSCRAIDKKQILIIAAGNTLISYYHEILGKPKLRAALTLRHVTHLAYNSLTGDILAFDKFTDKIISTVNKSAVFRDVISMPNERIGGMDFDYLGNNTYVSDVRSKTIEVYSMTTGQKTEFHYLEEPRSILVVPDHGIMYVVFHSGDKVHLDKMQMNGLGARIRVVDNDLLGPRVSLTYDREQQRVYWADQGSGRIESISVEGNDRQLFRTGLSEPMSIAILNGEVCWTGRFLRKIFWADKTRKVSGNQAITLKITDGIEIMHLVRIYSPYTNKDNGCSINNGGCSHVCLVSTLTTHICACPQTMILSTDNRTCERTMCAEGESKCNGYAVCIRNDQKCDGKMDCPNGDDESDCEPKTTCKPLDEFMCKNGDCISVHGRCNSIYDCKDHSDEENCTSSAICTSDEFRCREGTCISKYLVCNGHDDCSDTSDEMNCGARVCIEDSFKCASGPCIPKSWVCDGEPDCDDSSDEHANCTSSTCRDGMFTCDNSRCIDKVLVCNNVDDCGDNSEERRCPHGRSTEGYKCQEGSYKCFGIDKCIDKSLRCNGHMDCPKNDDEYNCALCILTEEFTCDNKKCIPKNWVCDKSDDCGDQSDERNCDGHLMKVNVNARPNCSEFQCSIGSCVSYSRVCDGIRDCLDGSDESGSCGVSCETFNPCEGICHKTPRGPVCSCRSGYKLRSDGKSCEDINECAENPCSHMCHNTDGSFVCSCFEGFILRKDQVTCKVIGPQMEIVAAAKDNIRKLSPSLSTIEVLFRDDHVDITGLDVNANRNAIYWSNDRLGMINKIDIRTKQRTTVSGVGKPEALAVDWATDNIYFYDDENPFAVKVCNLDEKKCAKLFTVPETAKVLSIAIDPNIGWLFWSQTSWGAFNTPSSEIYRTNMLGSNMTVIAYQQLGIVSGIAIDHRRSHIYWSDSFYNVIERANLDGTDRKVFIKPEMDNPLGINIYEDSLYWLMQRSGNLRKCSLHGNKNCETISIGPSNVDRHFAILHMSRQPFVANSCEDHKCDYMCILANGRSACICPNGYPLATNVTCSEGINIKVKFESVRAKSTRQEGGTIIGSIIIVVSITVAILAVYYYYHKKRPCIITKNDLSIRFQNPSYGQRNELLDYVGPVLPPGEHEYTNPIVNISSVVRNQDYARKADEVMSPNPSENEFDEEIRITHKTKLIHDFDNSSK